MEQLNYYRELLDLIEQEGSQTQFRNLYKKHFGKEPETYLVDQFLIETGEMTDSVAEEDDSYSYEPSYEPSYNDEDGDTDEYTPPFLNDY